ncbi:MAG: RDD family protein [Sedimentisphaerales bacterium]|nr:RDD family protein [Sedimentisphaerales bacterium]
MKHQEQRRIVTVEPESEENVDNLSSDGAENQAEALEFSPVPAGFTIRVAAAIIDFLVFLPVLAVSVKNLLVIKSVPVLLLITLPSFLYKPFMEWRYGATLGKMAMGIVVIDKHGHLLTLAMAYLRFIPNLVVGVLSVIGTLFLFQTQGFEQARTIIALGELEGPYLIQFLQWPLNLFVILDCLAVAFTDRKRAIHDFMAGSYCVMAKSLV